MEQEMNDETRDRMRELLRRLHDVEHQGREYYETIGELDSLVETDSRHAEPMTLEAMLRERLTEMAMNGSIKASPAAKDWLADADEEVEYLAEYTQAVSRAVAEGATGDPRVRVCISARLEVADEEGAIDIVAIELEVDHEKARHFIGIE